MSHEIIFENWDSCWIKEVEARHSVWSINLCKIKGIPIRLHLSLFLLFGWIALDAYSAHGRPLQEVLFVSSLFLCVLLHELGHALVAMHYKIRTRDIVLYPFGGVASIIGNAKPRAELFIALAGPMVNVIIALLLFQIPTGPMHMPLHLREDFLGRVILANIVLVVFNMIPALPMDGGRVLRASLALLGFKRATLMSARLSQVLSSLMAIFALYEGLPILLIISVLVFMSALQEYVHERTKVAATGHTVADVMTDLDHLDVFVHGTTVSQALRIAFRSLQSFFPVVHAMEVIGIVDKEVLFRNAATQGDDSYVSALMDREVSSIQISDSLEIALARFESQPHAPLLVFDGQRFVGMLFREKLLEYVLIRELRSRAVNQSESVHDDFPL